MAPMKVTQVRKQHKSWISRDSTDLMAARDLARRKAQVSQLPEDWSNYRQLRNKCSAKCKINKKTHFRNLFKNHEEGRDISKLYSLAKNQLGWRSEGPPSSLVVNGRVISAPKETAEAQSKFFQKKVADLKSNLPLLREVSLIVVVNAIKSLVNTTAYGHDRLDEMSLKMAAEHLYKPLTYLVNLSLRKSMFANKWKIERVVPLFKGKGLSLTEMS